MNTAWRLVAPVNIKETMNFVFTNRAKESEIYSLTLERSPKLKRMIYFINGEASKKREKYSTQLAEDKKSSARMINSLSPRKLQHSVVQ